MYTHYAAGGDLAKLLRRYARLGRQIPEPFIWLVFWALSDAIYTFNTGRISQEENREGPLSGLLLPDFTPIIHLDIKPESRCPCATSCNSSSVAESTTKVQRANNTPDILLGDPSEPYLSYPTPKVADFDSAFRLTQEVREAERGPRSEAGTPYWQAPEVALPALDIAISDKTGEFSTSGI